MWIVRLLALVIAFATFGQSAEAQTSGAMGFGAGTTGGSQPCRVREPTQAALEACTRHTGTTITFDKPWTITLEHPVNLASDQTVQGPAHLEGTGILLQIADKSNVVIRDMTFSSTAGGRCGKPERPEDVKHCGIAVNIKGHVRHVWLDHDVFTHCGEKCVEIWNEVRAGLDASGFTVAPDLITVSNSVFSDSYFCMAVGISAQTPNAAIRPNSERVTVVGNTFDRCFRRSVRAASGADVHEIANLIKHWGPQAGDECTGAHYGFGPSATGGGELLLERNVFVPWPNGPCKEAVDVSDYHSRVSGVERGAGKVRAVANEVVDGAKVTGNDPDAVFKPYYSLNVARPARR